MPEGIFHEVTPDQDCPIGDLTIHPFRISHDAAEPVAYRIGQGDREVGIATDMGVYDEYIVKNLEGLDALLLEANHDVNMLQVGKYPYYLKRRILGDKGHLSNETAGQLLCRLLHDNMKQILLGHLSRENNYEALAYETVCAEVTMGDNPYKAKDFRIDVAHRDTAIRSSRSVKVRRRKMKKTIITVVGKDTVGIIAKVCTYLARQSGEYSGYLTDYPAGLFQHDDDHRCQCM